MRSPITLAATLAAATLLATAPAAAAQTGPTPVAEAGTGSAAVDSGSNAARSAVDLAQRGDLVGFLVLLAITPIQMVTGGICDVVTGAGSANPCSPTRY
ncbi:hypothetical protein [Nocardia sp. AG03]|uniref:hypothetical protein n=1 Tax=Nocardia sp. AG03 TaxID=3025312 RepID=UPI002418844B|nr:hypothetical protein [Nocardia sp. AG03]